MKPPKQSCQKLYPNSHSPATIASLTPRPCKCLQPDRGLDALVMARGPKMPQSIPPKSRHQPSSLRTKPYASCRFLMPPLKRAYCTTPTMSRRQSPTKKSNSLHHLLFRIYSDYSIRFFIKSTKSPRKHYSEGFLEEHYSMKQLLPIFRQLFVQWYRCRLPFRRCQL